MLTLSADLEAAQQARRRRPVLALTVPKTRFGVPLLHFFASGAGSGVDCPMTGVFGTITGIGEFTVYVRNNAGALEAGFDANVITIPLDTVTAGQGFAVAYNPVAEEFLIAYGDGTALKLYTINSGGITGPTTLVTEASPIGAVALAVRSSNGNACAFYAIGTSTTVKRLRRTSGTWAGSGTTWSRTADVASVTGLAAVHSGNFYLAVTGTEATTTHERLWSVAMGDGPLPSNAWSSLVPIQEADAAAALTFHHPQLCYVNGSLFCSFQQTEAGNVAAQRVMLTHVTAAGDPLGYWREPYPPFESIYTSGSPLLYSSGTTTAVMVSPTNLYTSENVTSSNTITDRLLAATWRETPDSLRVRLELDYRALDPAVMGFTITPGQDVQLQHGFTLADGSEEFGIQVNAVVRSTSRRFSTDGKPVAIIEADGPWEALARYHAPAAWTAPSATTRGQIFARIAARAGIAVSDATGAFTPSSAWTTDTPLFAIGANETGRSVLQRLLAATPDFLRLASDGGFEVVDATGGIDEAVYRLPQTGGTLAPMALTVVAAARPAWVRLQAEDRYADAFDSSEPEQNFELVRDFSAVGDGPVTAGAAEALARRRLAEEAGQLVAPLHVGLELFDLVHVRFRENDGTTLIEDTYRALGRGVDFKRGPASGPAYTSTITLGEIG